MSVLGMVTSAELISVALFSLDPFTTSRHPPLDSVARTLSDGAVASFLRMRFSRPTGNESTACTTQAESGVGCDQLTSAGADGPHIELGAVDHVWNEHL